MSEETNNTSGATPPPAGAPQPTLKLRPALKPGGAVPPPASPAAPSPAAAPAPAAAPLKPTIRKPVIGIRKPVVGATAAKPAAAAPAANPKSVTAPIGALHKTGIVAEGVLTPAQQQAAKSKTSRISLESAMGVAPTKAPSPLKTIRMKRPGDLVSPAAKPAAAPSSLSSAPTASAPAPALSQRKTLKIHKPGEGAVKPPAGPAASPAVSKPSSPTLVVKKPAVADDVPPVAAPAPFAPPVDEDGTLPPVPGWLMGFTIVAAVAVLAITGFTGYLMYRQGKGPNAGGNCIAFMKDPAKSKVDWCHPESKGGSDSSAADSGAEESGGETPREGGSDGDGSSSGENSDED